MPKPTPKPPAVEKPALAPAGVDEKAAPSAEKQDHQKAWVPWGIYTFADLEIYKLAQEAAGEIFEATDELQQIIWNIMSSDEVVDKGVAVQKAAAEFERLIRNQQNQKGLLAQIKDKFIPEKKETPEPRFLVYKNDAGEYRWVASYSNNFRDDDTPAEIISAESHRQFVDRVDKGLAPLPELWLWHEKDWKVGEATWVGVDEISDGIVVALAAGHFDSDKQWVAEALARSGMSGVSHGMPIETIRRDQKDLTVITQHESREISPLPAERAANKLAGFATLKKEADMTISTQKRQDLAAALGLKPEAITAIEEANKATAAKGAAEGLETKEDGGQQGGAPMPAVPPVPAADVLGELPDKPVEEDPGDDDELDLSGTDEPDNQIATVASDMEDVKQSLQELKSLVASFQDGTGKALKNLADRVEAVEGAEKERVQKELEETPSAAFNDIVKSIIGEKKAAVQEGDPLNEQKPKETAAPDESGLPTFVTQLWQPG